MKSTGSVCDTCDVRNRFWMVLATGLQAPGANKATAVWKSLRMELYIALLNLISCDTMEFSSYRVISLDG